MAWTQSTPEPPRPFGAAPVPDIEALRRAALQASWRRDRRVAQRRTAMRWAAWYALRGLPLLAVAAAAWLWVWNQPTHRQTGGDTERPTEAALGAANASAQQVGSTFSTAVVPGSPVVLTVPPKPAPTQPLQAEPVLQPRLESPLQSALAAPGPQSASLPLAGKTATAPVSPSPQLKPDN